MTDEQLENIKQFRQQQEKYVYYVIALAVAAIGFSILKTFDQPIKLSQLPLALAVFSWGISVFCGLNFLQYVLSNMYSNNIYFDIMKGNHPEVGQQPELIEAAASSVKKGVESNSDTASDFFKWQNRLFYFGIIAFIFWRVLEMSLLATRK